MKVKIGPYKNWIGPYQIAEKILFWKDKDEDCRVFKFGTWLSENKSIVKLCEWINNNKTRKISVKLDSWDSWNADYTLALIILPVLKQLKESKHGAPNTEDEDVPEHLRSTSAPPKENEWDTDENWFKRWEWIMDEMIWTFEQLASDDDESQFYYHYPKTYPGEMNGWVWIDGFRKMEGFWVDRPGEENHRKRIDNGLRLFGRYYRGLWD